MRLEKWHSLFMLEFLSHLDVLRVCCQNKLYGLRWPSGKVSASRPEDSMSDSTEDPPCMRGLLHVKSSVGAKRLPLRWCGSLERGCQLSYCLRHLTAVQNYKVCP
ncbi:hypothetical protein AVEN_213688-1 [Araneus ventricosus]|uniref:Secreted protein n=1 Tax=Araneus ventricosus TaxID=182803 RepID=A0A4Y2S2B5_ARAVE|nr:hypothetical protein AVEN_213688-1 [Araneus ventricosus]